MYKETAKEKVIKYMEEHKTADTEELMTNVNIDLKLLVEIIDELKEEGKLVGKEEKYQATFSERVIDQMDKLPEEDQAEIYEAIEKICENPREAGSRVVVEEPDKTSICPECGSDNTFTWIDTGCEPNEVHFICFNCDNSFWTDEKDYRYGRKNRPELFADKKPLCRKPHMSCNGRAMLGNCDAIPDLKLMCALGDGRG